MKWLLTIALLTISFSGCLEGQLSDGTDNTSQAPVDSTGPAGEPASGTPATHGEPEINEGPEEVYPPEGNRPWWEVRQVITIDNDFGGAAASELSLSVDVGEMNVAPSPDGDYHYTLTLVGGGGTQTEAQAAFDDISWDHLDELSDGALHLTTWIDGFTSTGGSCSGIPPLAQCTGQYWRGFITALVPALPAHSIDIDSATADYSVQGLGGGSLTVDTSTGDGELDDLEYGAIRITSSTGDASIDSVRCGEFIVKTSTGDFDLDDFTALAMDVTTSTGDLDLDDGTVVGITISTDTGDFSLDTLLESMSFTSSTGDLFGDLTPTGTGALSIRTQTGDVDLDFPAESNLAYDVDARTQNGDIQVDVSNGETLVDEEERVHKRTVGFGDAAIQTTVTLTTSTGDITVQA